MEPIKVPTGMSNKDIPVYVKQKLNAPTITFPEKPEPTKPKSYCNPLVIPGDDWATNTRGLRGKKELRKLMKQHKTNKK